MKFEKVFCPGQHKNKLLITSAGSHICWKNWKKTNKCSFHFLNALLINKYELNKINMNRIIEIFFIIHIYYQVYNNNKNI